MTNASPASSSGAVRPGSAIDVLRRFIRDAPTALAMLDTEFRYVAASSGWCSVLHLEPEGLEGKSHLELLPNLPEHFLRAHERALAGTVERGDADPIVTADGLPGFCRWEMRPWYTDTGAIGGITIFKEDITERVNSHRALVESDRNLRFALNASKAGTWSVDMRTGQVQRDARSRELFGFASPDDDNLESLMGNFPEEYQAYKRGRLESIRCNVEDNEWNEVLQLPNPDGSMRWLHELGRVERNEEGEAIRMAGLIFDVTEQRRADQSLRLALSAASASAWTWSIDADTIELDPRGVNLVRVSDGARHAREQLRQQIHPEDRDYVKSVMRGIKDGADGWDMEYRLLRDDGQVLWRRSVARTERDLSGRPVNVSGIATDVTEQHREDAALRSALKGASASAWTWWVDSDTIVVDPRGMNPLHVEAGTSRPRETVLNNVHADDRDRVRETMTRTRDENADGWDIEYRLVLRDGGILWHRSVGTSERDMHGRLLRVSGISSDITERKMAQLEIERSHESLRQYAAELERRTQQLRRLATDLTLAEQRAREQLAKTLHDHLQQLLFSARLNIERVAESAADPTLLDEARANLLEAIASARSLSVELFPPVLHQGDFPESLAWLAEHEQRTFGIRIAAHVSPDANPAGHDVRTLLFESVRELLFNAAKHAHVGDVTLDAVVDESGHLVITVSDKGVGFDPATLEGSRTGGLGLLSIQERITLLGGTFEIASARGQGARFTLRVPAASSPRRSPQPASVGKVAVGSPAQRRAAGESRPLRILIADDHVLVRAGLREQLARYAEFRVVGEATDGLDAVSKTGTLAPDVVIMDVSMPVLDGVDATARIHANWPDVSVIALSAQEQASGGHAIERAGASAYFSKTEGVTEMIAHLLQVHAAMAVTQPA